MTDLLAELRELTDVHNTGSDGSDLEVGDFSDNDDFTQDNRRYLDVIGREIEYLDQMEAMRGQAQGTENDSDDQDVDPGVLAPQDLNATPEWLTNNFVHREELRCNLNAGNAEQYPEHTQPSQYFGLFWTEEWWQHLVVQTNLYATQQGAPAKWVPVTVADMKAFIGLTLAMGVLKFHARADYWRTSKRLYTTQFGKVMSRDRYLLIWRYLHIADNQAPQDNPDKLAKLRPMIDHLNDAFKSVYTPYRDVAIDESMVKFKGRIGFRQYMPSKPIKWGIQIWAMSESTTGYMSSFKIYTGREAGQNAEHGLAHRVVKDLVAPYHHTGIRVYMDNFYTGVPLLLSSLGIGACGTVRSNRKFLPAALLPKRVQLQKHEYKTAQAGNLTFGYGWTQRLYVSCPTSMTHSRRERSTGSQDTRSSGKWRYPWLWRTTRTT